MIPGDKEPKPSKQQQKREAEAAQALGAELVKLPSAQLNAIIDKLALPDDLREALLACRKIRAHEAHRRQLQYIGKLMRQVDTAAIAESIADVQRKGQVAAAQLHHIERWRDRLLRKEDGALDELLQAYPKADAAQLTQLIATAQQESARRQPPRAARMLFRYLRELMVT